jgi:hypothetical protein
MKKDLGALMNEKAEKVFSSNIVTAVETEKQPCGDDACANECVGGTASVANMSKTQR